MDYFLLKQDERYTNTPRLRDIFYKVNVKNINRENSHKIDDVVIFQVDAEERCEYIDILDKQIFLISEKLINVIFKYDPEMTIYKKIVLDKEKIQEKKIFRIKEISKNLVVVRLDVAESILRRKPKGICLERLEVR